MAYDADAMLEALEPPTFTAFGHTFRGRLMSAPAWLQLHVEKEKIDAQVRELTDAGKGYDAFVLSQKFVHKTICAFFPRPWYALFNPALAAFKAMPLKIQTEMLEDFCESQRRSMPETRPTRDESASE